MKVFLMTHLYISPILNAVELMTHLEIQCCLDDSSSDGDIAVASKRLLFHKGSQVSSVDHQNPALNDS